MREECSDLNLEPWTEPAGSICMCVVVVSALRGSNIMHPFYIVYIILVLSFWLVSLSMSLNDKLSSVSLANPTVSSHLYTPQ